MILAIQILMTITLSFNMISFFSQSIVDIIAGIVICGGMIVLTWIYPLVAVIVLLGLIVLYQSSRILR